MKSKVWLKRHDNTRVSPNSRDVLKLRVVSKICDPHPKHLLDMTQTEMFKKLVKEDKISEDKHDSVDIRCSLI